MSGLLQFSNQLLLSPNGIKSPFSPKSAGCVPTQLSSTKSTSTTSSISSLNARSSHGILAWSNLQLTAATEIMQQQRRYQSTSSPRKHNIFARIEEIDLSKLRFEEPKKTKVGGIFIPIRYGDASTTLKIQTPTLRAPFGVNIFQQGNKESWSIPVSFDDLETNAKVKKFHDFLMQLDKVLVGAAKKNSKLWFKKDLTSEQIIGNYVPVLKVQEKYAPLMKLKIPSRGSDINGKREPMTVVFNDRLEVPLETIQKGARLVNIIDLSSVWIVNKQFGTSWSVLQSKIIDPGPVALSGYQIQDSEIDRDIAEHERSKHFTRAEDDVEIEDEEADSSLERRLQEEDDDEPREVQEVEEEDVEIEEEIKPKKKPQVKTKVQSKTTKKVQVEDEDEEEEEEEEPVKITKKSKGRK